MPILEEALSTLRRPQRLLRLFSPEAWRRKIRFYGLRRLGRSRWSGDPGSMSSKQFRTYEDYLELQKSKLEFMELAGHEKRFRKALAERLSALPMLRGRTALCLAARLGGEVRAFKDLGYFAVGIDLNPGVQNDAVCYGDFHDLQYPDRSADVVYTNSLDHVLKLDRLLAEAARVLSSDGVFIVEADPGAESEDGTEPDLWATTRWATVDALQARIAEAGFVPVHRAPFVYPRNGEMLVFTPPGS